MFWNLFEFFFFLGVQCSWSNKMIFKLFFHNIKLLFVHFSLLLSYEITIWSILQMFCPLNGKMVCYLCKYGAMARGPDLRKREKDSGLPKITMFGNIIWKDKLNKWILVDKIGPEQKKQPTYLFSAAQTNPINIIRTMKVLKFQKITFLSRP